MRAKPQVSVSLVPSRDARGKPELPGWREMTRDHGESFAAQPWTERDDRSVVHLREAAELGEPAAGRDRALASTDGTEQMAAFGGSVREQEPEVGLPCALEEIRLPGLHHTRDRSIAVSTDVYSRRLRAGGCRRELRLGALRGRPREAVGVRHRATRCRGRPTSGRGPSSRARAGAATAR